MRPYHGRVRIVKQRGGSIVVLACLLSVVTLTAMSHRSRPGLILPFLALSFGLATGCKTSVPQPPQAQTAGLRIDVQKVSSSARKQRIDVSLKIWNDHEQRISFDLGNVRLLFNGREVSPSPALTKDPNPDVQAKSNRQLYWSFEVGDVIGEGTYPIEIREIHKGDMPLGEKAEFRINIGA